VSWKRWLKYARAKVESVVRSGNRELGRREAELEARQAGKPWLTSDDDSPTFEDAKARIEHESGTSGDLAFDHAQQERAAAERLKRIRDHLGVDEDPPT